jgi:hypothetical protein
VAQFLADYIFLPEIFILALTAWVMAAWLMDVWDRFPHLCISSPEKRCGKSLLLELLSLILPNPKPTTNISPAALYRVIAKERPTLLMDEAQFLARRGSEASEVVCEILNAGISKAARVTRCGGKNWDKIEEFNVYSPKVFALIGPPNGVLADRCLVVELRRKTKNEPVKRYRSREVESIGQSLSAELGVWAEKNRERIDKTYAKLEPFPIDNDRMADLLIPLQAVLEGEPLEVLRLFAEGIDERDREMEMQTPGVRLLLACREIFGESGLPFVPTHLLIECLVKHRQEEPWSRWHRGQPIGNEALAKLLRPFEIKPARNREQSCRGYHRADFVEAWARYLPPLA